MSEVWRVSTPEGIFETDLETLKQWIGEGCVLPTDKVSKGNLSWIDAGRVPKLKDAFSGEMTPAPESTSTTAWVEPAAVVTPTPTDVCHNHPEAAPDYVCRMCGALLCTDCTKFVRERVPICPLCGDLCRAYRAVKEQAVRAEFQRSGFGSEDFLRAIRYPLQHKLALLGGALIYGLLLLLGVRGSALAWTIMFGCISQVFTEVAWGRLNRSFMPDFTSSSFWEDRFNNAALGVGITIISWGPLIILLLALLFGVLDSGVEASAFGARDAPESISQEDLSVLADPEADPAKLEEANKKVQELRPGAQIAREAERSDEEASDPASVLMNLLPSLWGTSIGFLFLLCIAWGVFYYPMALTVAGYTQSFGSVVNPVVGLDTIRLMGTTYFKAFAMVLVVQVITFVAGVTIWGISSPFEVPLIGNVIGTFVNATFTFYFNLVIACILGLSLFKCADRLDINVN